MDTGATSGASDASGSRLRMAAADPMTPSSDVGEIEEARAALLGERYWTQIRRAPYTSVGAAAFLPGPQPDLSDDELAMSPIRPMAKPAAASSSSSKTIPRRRMPSPSLRQPAQLRSAAVSASASATSPPHDADKDESLPHPDDVFEGAPRNVSPARSDASDDVLDLVLRKRPEQRQSGSPPSSNTPTPASPQHNPNPALEATPAQASQDSAKAPSTPEIPPDLEPPLAGGPRALRTRTARQLKPFSLEWTKYSHVLYTNGWEGAVVAPERGSVELSAEELKRRKELHAKRPKNHLGGWLVSDEEYDGSTAGEHGTSGGSKGQPSSSAFEESLESEDGLNLLEREARRKERQTKIARDRARTSREYSPHRHGPSRLDQPEGAVGHTSKKRPSDSKPRKRPTRSNCSDDDDSGSATEREAGKVARQRRMRAESAPASASPASSPQKRKRIRKSGPTARRNGASAQTGAGGKPSTSVRRIRADSEPPNSSPNRSDVVVISGRKRCTLKPSKRVHAAPGTQGRSALDRDILNLPDMHLSSAEDSDREDSPRYRSDGESEQPSTDDEEPDEYALRPEDLGPARLKLGGKRKRFLGAMMPGAFIKKAEADLKLMAKEVQLSDYSDGSEINSGDEEALERAKQRNLARKRKAPGLRDDPLRFDGDAFTDESGTDEDRSDDGLGAAEDEEAENDAVASWLYSFAPQRAQRGDEDIVDRFLKRAKRPPKRKRSGHPRAAAERDRRKDRQGSREPGVSKKRKRRVGSVDATDVYVIGGNRPLAADAFANRRRKAIPLDTDEALFAFAQAVPEVPAAGVGDRAPSAEPAPVGLAGPRIQSDIPPIAADGDQAGEAWASYNKFSHDFGLQRLPAGLRIDHEDSFVSNGHLASLLDPARPAPPLLSCDVFGLTLASDDDAETISAVLPSIVDGIFSNLEHLSSAGNEQEVALGTRRAFQFLGRWISSAENVDIGSALKALAFHLDRLETRLTTLPESASSSKPFRLARAEIAWYRLDLAIRSQRRDAEIPNDRVRTLISALLRDLLHYGPERTVKVLKTACDQPTVAITDQSVALWLGLVSLASPGAGFGASVMSGDDFWSLVLDAVDAFLPARARSTPVRGEVLSYSAVLLSSVSQFNSTGLSTARPRLQSYWPVALQTLEAISPAALARSDLALSSTAIARRDRYLWTLFARCLVFIERWNWRVDVKDDLLTRLADLLRARRFADLTTEATGDFPPFLQDASRFNTAPLDPKTDTAFAVFLKVIIAATRHLPFDGEADQRKRGAQLTRLFLRLSPMVSTSWTEASPELTNGPSTLTNHISLYLTFALLHPQSAAQRVEQARRLVNFTDVGEEARRICIRAALYFGLAFRQRDLPFDDVLDWLADMLTTLKGEYSQLERDQRKQRHGRDARPSGPGDPLWQRAVLITMALRSVQLVTRWRRSGATRPEYPATSFLNPAWTSRLLETQLALDPMIGREAIKTIDCFLDVRAAALAPAPAVVVQTSGESQDSYGDLDLDFDDPALNALLGMAAPAVDPQAELRAKDKAAAELLKTAIAPAFFRLVSNILADHTSSGPTVGDRVSYAQTVVSTWARCLSVAVENGVADWKPYLQYGDQSWKRLSDPVGRRDIGLFLVTEMLKRDPGTHSVFPMEILEVWLDSMVARRLTSQHTLTTALLNAETPPPLLDGLPFARSVETGTFEVEQLDLLDRRLEVLTRVFANAARLAVAASTAQQPPSTAQLLHRAGAQPMRPVMTRAQVMNLLRSMLAAMRDNIGAIQDEATRRQYAGFVRSVLGMLIAAGSAPSGPPGRPGRKGPFDEVTLPDIKTLRSLTA